MSEKRFLFRYGLSNIVQCDITNRYTAGFRHEEPIPSEIANLKNPTLSENLRQSYFRNHNFKLQHMKSSGDIVRVVENEARLKTQFFIKNPGSSPDHPIVLELAPIQLPIIQ